MKTATGERMCRKRLINASRTAYEQLQLLREVGASHQLVVVVFPLMPNSTNDDGAVVDDFKERHIARSAKCDDQFAGERAVTDFATCERRCAQQADASINGMARFFRNFQIPGWTVEFTLDQEIENPLQVFVGSGAELNCEAHALRCARDLRAAASFASS